MTLVIRTEEACRPPKTTGKRALLSSISQLKGKDDKSTYQAHKEKEMWQRLKQSKDPYLVMLFKSSWGDEGDDIRVIQRPKRVQLEQKKEPPKPKEPGSVANTFVYPPQVRKKRYDDSAADKDNPKKADKREDASAAAAEDEWGSGSDPEGVVQGSMNLIKKQRHRKLRRKIRGLATGIAPKDNMTYMASLRENMQQASETWNEGIESEYRNLDFYDRAGYLRKKEEARKEQIRLRNIARGQPWREREREGGSDGEDSLAGSEENKPDHGTHLQNMKDRHVHRVRNHLPQCLFNPQNSHTTGLSLGFKAPFKFPRKDLTHPSSMVQMLPQVPHDLAGMHDAQSPVFLTEAPQSPSISVTSHAKLQKGHLPPSSSGLDVESEHGALSTPQGSALVPSPFQSRGALSKRARVRERAAEDAGGGGGGSAPRLSQSSVQVDADAAAIFPLCSMEDVQKFQKAQGQPAHPLRGQSCTSLLHPTPDANERRMSANNPADDEEARRLVSQVCECSSDEEDTGERLRDKVSTWRRQWHLTRARLDHELKRVLHRRGECRAAVAQSYFELANISRQASAGGQTWSRCRAILPEHLKLRPASSMAGTLPLETSASGDRLDPLRARTPQPAMGVGRMIAGGADAGKRTGSATPTPKAADSPTDALVASIEEWKRTAGLLRDVVERLEEGATEIGSHRDTDSFRYDVRIMLAEGEKLTAQNTKVKGFSSSLAVGAREKRSMDQTLNRLKTLTARFRKISRVYYHTEQSRQSPELLLHDPKDVPWGKSVWGAAKDDMDAEAQHAQQCAALYARMRHHFLSNGFPSSPTQQDFCMILRQLFVDSHALDYTFLQQLILHTGASFAQRDTLKMLHFVAAELHLPQEQVAAIVKDMKHVFSVSTDYLLRTEGESPLAAETPLRSSVTGGMSPTTGPPYPTPA